MKGFIKFLRLDSLCGQLVAIAVLSLAALQCVNYYAVYSIQQSYAGEFLAVGHDYLASVCQALAHMSAAEREEYLASLDRSRGALAKPFRFRAAEAPEWETETDYYKSVLAREAVTEILTRAGIPPRDVRARVLYGDSPEASEPRFAGYVFPMMQMLVQDGGGSWLELVQPLSVTDRRLIWRQRIFIMLESLICSAAVIMLIVRAMLPLFQRREPIRYFFLGRSSVELFIVEHRSARSELTYRRRALVRASAAVRAEGDYRFTRELRAFEEGHDGRRYGVPPDGVAEEYHVVPREILRHGFERGARVFLKLALCDLGRRVVVVGVGLDGFQAEYIRARELRHRLRDALRVARLREVDDERLLVSRERAIRGLRRFCRKSERRDNCGGSRKRKKFPHFHFVLLSSGKAPTADKRRALFPNCSCFVLSPDLC